MKNAELNTILINSYFELSSKDLVQKENKLSSQN